MKIFTVKLIISVILIITGVALGLMLTHTEEISEQTTVTLDFGNYHIENVKVDEDSNAAEALVSLCEKQGYTIEYNSDGSVKTINDLPQSGDDRTWNLYTLESSSSGGWKWEKYNKDPTSLEVSSEKSISWGLCSDGETPTTTVDATGHSFYGLGEVKTIVCLAPSCTETVCELGYEEYIIGTDRYSNYPSSIEQKRNMGIITETGSYTSPNFEIIVKLNPDLVIGISSQNGHIKVAEKLRSVGINTILTTDGEDLKTVYDNTYMCGVAIGDVQKAEEVTTTLQSQVEETYGYISSTISRPGVMVALSADKAPWVAGINTYVSDIYNKSGAFNTFDKSKNPSIADTVDGWKQVNSESIVQGNPEYIIVISSDGVSESKYKNMIDNLPDEWKYTDAYKNGKIYLVGDSAGDMMSRPSTRLAQLTELLGRVLHPDAFPELIEVPMWIGNDYTDYLTYSKEL